MHTRPRPVKWRGVAGTPDARCATGTSRAVSRRRRRSGRRRMRSAPGRRSPTARTLSTTTVEAGNRSADGCRPAPDPRTHEAKASGPWSSAKRFRQSTGSDDREHRPAARLQAVRYRRAPTRSRSERKPYARGPVAASRCEVTNRRLRSIVRDRNCTGRRGQVATDHLLRPGVTMLPISSVVRSSWRVDHPGPAPDRLGHSRAAGSASDRRQNPRTAICRARRLPCASRCRRC